MWKLMGSPIRRCLTHREAVLPKWLPLLSSQQLMKFSHGLRNLRKAPTPTIRLFKSLPAILLCRLEKPHVECLSLTGCRARAAVNLIPFLGLLLPFQDRIGLPMLFLKKLILLEF